MEIDVDHPHNFLVGCSEEKRTETRNRLIELKDLGHVNVGYYHYGIPGVVSGTYHELVWNLSEEAWRDRIEWIKSLIDKNKKDG